MQTSLKNLYQLFVIFTMLTVCGIVLFTFRIVSLGWLLPFNRMYAMPFISKLTMSLVGIKLDLSKKIELPNQPVFITFNHNSYLDIFALTALGLNNTRFMLSEKTIKILPVTLVALSIGVTYIPQKKHKKRRLAYFERIEKEIMTKKFNIAGSSEGVHEHKHHIDNFNKGVYHMATVCKLNIIPLFIWVPEASNPFNKYRYFKRGTIFIEPMETISTEGWTLQNIDENKEAVRSLFVAKFEHYNKL
jgi:1-acyl-sn-glycerol-3-phosphate acyltransferase